MEGGKQSQFVISYFKHKPAQYVLALWKITFMCKTRGNIKQFLAFEALYSLGSHARKRAIRINKSIYYANYFT
jgi:hypothetical protein